MFLWVDESFCVLLATNIYNLGCSVFRCGDRLIGDDQDLKKEFNMKTTAKQSYTKPVLREIGPVGTSTQMMEMGDVTDVPLGSPAGNVLS